MSRCARGPRASLAANATTPRFEDAPAYSSTNASADLLGEEVSIGDSANGFAVIIENRFSYPFGAPTVSAGVAFRFRFRKSLNRTRGSGSAFEKKYPEYAAPIAQVLAEVFVFPRENLSSENFILSSELYQAAELSLCSSEISFVF